MDTSEKRGIGLADYVDSNREAQKALGLPWQKRLLMLKRFKKWRNRPQPPICSTYGQVVKGGADHG